MRFQIQIEGCDDRFSCSEEQTVLRSTEIGIKRRIPVGARVMSRAHLTREDQDQGRVLACCIWPTSDLRVRVLGSFRKSLV